MTEIYRSEDADGVWYQFAEDGVLLPEMCGNWWISAREARNHHVLGCILGNTPEEDIVMCNMHIAI